MRTSRGRRSSSTKDRLMLGLLGGVFYFVLYASVDSVVSVVLNRRTLADVPGRGHMLPYLLIGLGGGALVGLLWPLRDRWWGSIVLGAVAAVAVFIGLPLIVGSQSLAHYATAAALALPIGATIGYRRRRSRAITRASPPP